MAVKVGNKWVGEGYPCFVVAEIGINHNGSINIAKQLIDAAVEAGVDAVKFQKMLDMLDDLDDVQEVFTSAILPD